MADFKAAKDKVLKVEGGYSNDPTDTGGETWRGIARKKNPAWPGWAIVDALRSDKNFPQVLATRQDLNALIDQFYKSHYWDVLNLDKFKYQAVAEEMLDISINMGQGVAAIFIQRIVNVYNKKETTYKNIVIDGRVGEVTTQLVNDKVNEEFALKCLNVLQGEKYFAICENNESQERFIAGWILQRVKL